MQHVACMFIVVRRLIASTHLAKGAQIPGVLRGFRAKLAPLETVTTWEMLAACCSLDLEWGR